MLKPANVVFEVYCNVEGDLSFTATPFSSSWGRKISLVRDFSLWTLGLAFPTIRARSGRFNASMQALTATVSKMIFSTVVWTFKAVTFSKKDTMTRPLIGGILKA